MSWHYLQKSIKIFVPLPSAYYTKIIYTIIIYTISSSLPLGLITMNFLINVCAKYATDLPGSNNSLSKTDVADGFLLMCNRIVQFPLLYMMCKFTSSTVFDPVSYNREQLWNILLKYEYPYGLSSNVIACRRAL